MNWLMVAAVCAGPAWSYTDSGFERQADEVR